MYSPLAEALNTQPTTHIILSTILLVLLWKNKRVNKIDNYVFFFVLFEILFLIIHTYLNPSSLSPNTRFILNFIIFLFLILYSKDELDFVIKNYIKIFSLLSVIGWIIIIIDLLDTTTFNSWASQNISFLKDTGAAKRLDFNYYFPFFIFCFCKSPEIDETTLMNSIFPYNTFASSGFTTLFTEPTTSIFHYFFIAYF
jgi:hypothetical protein